LTASEKRQIQRLGRPIFLAFDDGAIAMKTQTFSLERAMTPTGRMLVVTDDEQNIRAVDWEDHEQRMLTLLGRHYGAKAFRLSEASRPSEAQRLLNAYFEGDIDALSGYKTATNGTDFQLSVWRALRQIPPGHTISYGTLAVRIGRPAATRAVGLANGANPVAIVVPCHRVIGANASLTGYGGGLDRKRWLLAHEGRHLASHGGDYSGLGEARVARAR
jgi:methylated-DNA-[protein]-cysteine S-methyltransferase